VRSPEGGSSCLHGRYSSRRCGAHSSFAGEICPRRGRVSKPCHGGDDVAARPDHRGSDLSSSVHQPAADWGISRRLIRRARPALQVVFTGDPHHSDYVQGLGEFVPEPITPAYVAMMVESLSLDNAPTVARAVAATGTATSRREDPPPLLSRCLRSPLCRGLGRPLLTTDRWHITLCNLLLGLTKIVWGLCCGGYCLLRRTQSSARNQGRLPAPNLRWASAGRTGLEIGGMR
jgi:hypothetical protein